MSQYRLLLLLQCVVTNDSVLFYKCASVMQLANIQVQCQVCIHNSNYNHHLKRAHMLLHMLLLFILLNGYTFITADLYI